MNLILYLSIVNVLQLYILVSTSKNTIIYLIKDISNSFLSFLTLFSNNKAFNILGIIEIT